MNYETYIDLGWSVIPINRDTKQPLLSSWREYQTRRPDITEVREWDKRFPEANLAVVTGAISGIGIVDVEKDGIAEAERRGIHSPVKVATGNGFHYYFRHPGEKVKNVNTLHDIKGFDVRGDGGYAIIPPSIHPSGLPYRWLGNYRAALPEFPKEVFNAFRESTRPTLSDPAASPQSTLSVWVENALGSLKEGNRHQTFLRVSGVLHNKGIPDDMIILMLKPYAERCGFASEELIKIVTKYPTPKQPEPVMAASIDEFLSADEAEIKWHVDDFLPQGCIGFIAGLPGTSKTWLMMDLALELIRGGTWAGKYKTNPGRVLFIDQERPRQETKRRFKALMKNKRMGLETVKDRLFIRSGTSTRINLEPSFQAFRKELELLRPDLIIVDSFVTFHTADENSRLGIQPVMEKLKALRNEFGCTFLFIDHETKETFMDKAEGIAPNAMRIVGSVAKAAAAEFALSVRRTNENTSFVYHMKASVTSIKPPFMIQVLDKTPDKSEIEVKGV